MLAGAALPLLPVVSAITTVTAADSSVAQPWHWLLAAAWLAGLPLAVRALRPWLLARLLRLAEPRQRGGSPRRREQSLHDAVAALRLPLVSVIALLPAQPELRLPAPWGAWVEGAAATALFAQLGLCIAAFVDRWITASRDQALQDSPEAATGLAAASFLLRLMVWSLLLLVLLDNLGVNVTALLAGLGVGGIAVGLALQSILKDLFASLSIVLDKPFQIGHFIIVDGLGGTVENIGLKTTRVRALDGEQYVFSNADLTMARLRNFRTLQERRIVYEFALHVDTEPQLLQQLPGLLAGIVGAQRHARFDRAHLKSADGAGLGFELVFWITCPDFNVGMDVRQAVTLGLLRVLREHGARLAQPVYDVVLRRARSAIREGGAAPS